MSDEQVFAAMFATIGFISASNARFLAPSIVFALGLVAIFPSTSMGLVLMFLYLPALLITVLRR